jgi:hypothetical protein
MGPGAREAFRCEEAHSDETSGGSVLTGVGEPLCRKGMRAAFHVRAFLSSGSKSFALEGPS